MGKVQELVITKGKTIKAGDSEEWVHVEYSIKAVVDSETDLETAKAHLEGLEDGWLTGIAGLASTAPAKAPTPVATSPIVSLLCSRKNSPTYLPSKKRVSGSP
jgi:hypothetical protein